LGVPVPHPGSASPVGCSGSATLTRESEGFAAYLRSQCEWGIARHRLVRGINVETRGLIAAIEQEMATP
jgi:hypothetical protein